MAESSAELPRMAMAGKAGIKTTRLLLLFFVLMLIPAYFEVAGLRLSPLRLLVLATFVPMTGMLLSGKYGRLTIVDGLLFSFSVWVVMMMVLHHGSERVGLAGMTVAEIMGGYVLGRAAVRDERSYRIMMRIFFLSLVVLLPFAIVETITGRLVIPELISKFASSHYRGISATPRMGFERVYSVFEHPILFGLYCSMGIANAFYAFKSGSGVRLLFVILATGMSFLSLSSAPLLACALQVALALWAWGTGGRWTLLLVLGAIAYVVVDLLSNRTPITLFITYATFNPGTGWGRIAINEAGFAAVMANPLFGIGLNDWPRPAWVGPSVDNFWLLNAMRYGVPGFLMLLFAFLAHIYLTARAKITNPQTQRLRLGHLIALVAACFCLITVHIWGATLVFMFFYLGAGAFFFATDIDSDETADGADSPSDSPRRLRYTRFPEGR